MVGSWFHQEYQAISSRVAESESESESALGVGVGILGVGVGVRLTGRHLVIKGVRVR